MIAERAVFDVAPVIADEGIGIHQDRLQACIERCLSIQQQQAGLRGNGKPDAIGNHQPGTAIETLFGQEQADIVE